MAENPRENDGGGLGLTLSVLDGLPDPVIVLAADRRVVAANRAARDVLGIQLLGRDLAQSVRHPAVLAAVAAVQGGEASRSLEVSMPPPVRRTFVLYAARLPGPADGIIVVLRDVTLAKRAEETRADFVANVSHELRSPLSALLGMIETLRGAARDDAAARERFLDIMHAEARRMSRLIDDLLSLAKIETREHIASTDAVDLAHVLTTVTELLHVRAAEKKMTFAIELASDLAPVVGDRDELVQIFQNLVDNAVKYGGPGTPIGVLARNVDRLPESGRRGVAVAIRDRGEGIPPDDIPRLTERFYRLDRGRSRSLGGTGLGLAIVKHIVNRHRGRLLIESRLGHGSTFTVMLPAAGEDGEEPGNTAGTAGPA